MPFGYFGFFGMKNKINIGILGCADIAIQAMLPALKNCQFAELRAVASRTAEKATEIAGMFNCDAVVGYETLLARTDIDAVYIPLPTGLHEEWVIKALEAGKHILVEKSFAMNYESAMKMIKTAKEKKLLILENFLFPHHSQSQWIRDTLDSGRIGEIRLFRSTFGFSGLSPDNIRFKPELGGGALYDVGTYVLKASTMFLGSNLEILGGDMNYDSSYGVDISGHALLKNKENQIAQISYGFNQFYQCNFEFLGSEGKLTVTRSFTPKPGLKPVVVLETKQARDEIELPADDFYLNMWNYFTGKIACINDYDSIYEELLSHSRLMDKFRNEAL
jgi:dTDP-3,4-didehydro-2,6-dideoxy-alpha-D-glucose 3-reductase